MADFYTEAVRQAGKVGAIQDRMTAATSQGGDFWNDASGWVVNVGSGSATAKLNKDNGKGESADPMAMLQNVLGNPMVLIALVVVAVVVMKKKRG